jgi:predicted nucleic acid-binding protein
MGLRGGQLIVDTGALFALVDEADEFHDRAVALLGAFPGDLLVPALVVAETAFLIGRALGGRTEALLLADLAGSDMTVDHIPLDEWARIGELVARYADLPLGTVDATVVAAAERLGVTAIATTDRRHFSVVRPAHAEAFELPLLD